MAIWSPWWAYIGIAALFAAGAKLLSTAASGETRHEDGGQVYARIPLDAFTRILFAVLGLILVGVGLFVTIFNFGHIF